MSPSSVRRSASAEAAFLWSGGAALAGLSRNDASGARPPRSCAAAWRPATARRPTAAAVSTHVLRHCRRDVASVRCAFCTAGALRRAPPALLREAPSGCSEAPWLCMSSDGTRPPHPLKIIVFGAPASGKGTQCALIAERYGCVHLSTGDMLRAAVAADSSLGRQAKQYMDAGELVPDELVIRMVRERIGEADAREHGWLLDGFPRTPAQAAALDVGGVVPDVVLQLVVPDDVIVERVTGRRLDPATGRVYHMSFAPPPPDDAAMRARLVHRSDDTEAKARVRLEAYHEHARQLAARYAQRTARDGSALMHRVDGARSKESVLAELCGAIDAAREREARTAAQRSASPQRPRVPKVILHGAPGAGRRAQGAALAERFGCVHVSMGDLLRDAIAADTPLGRQARGYVTAGELVPDELAMGALRERMARDDVRERGWVLSGVPRTPAQAAALDADGVLPDVVIALDAPDEVLIERVTRRRVHARTGAVSTLDSEQELDGGDGWMQREDDVHEVARRRLGVFYSYETEVERIYAERLTRVDGTRPMEEVFTDVADIVRRVLNESSSPSSSSFSPSAPAAAADEGGDADEQPASGASIDDLETMLAVEDTLWSGQAGLDMYRAGESSWIDLTRRPLLALGDALAFLLYAWIGRASHSPVKSIDLVVLRTAAPFVATWIVVAPWLSVFTERAQSGRKAVLWYTGRAWAVCVPLALMVRGVAMSRAQPMPFVAVTGVTTLVLLVAWRLAHARWSRPSSASAGDKRGNLLDGVRMVTTLLNRW